MIVFCILVINESISLLILNLVIYICFFSCSSIIILIEPMDILVLNFYGLGTKRFHSIFKNRIMRFEPHLTSPHQKHVYTPLAHLPYCTLFAPLPPSKKNN